MKITLTTIIFCFFFFFLNAQSDIIKVSYKVKRVINKENKIEKLFLQTFKNYENISEELDFTLLINDTIGVFFLENKLYSNKGTIDLVKIKVDYFGRIQQNKSYYVTENLEEDFGKFLVSRSYQDWQLIEETKMIDSYLCFKAKTFYEVITPNGKTIRHDFVAWYSPQLPYTFGPIGFGNLPGLIMELQAKDFTYGVNKIDIYKGNSNELPRFPKLKKLKLITSEELELMAAEYEKKRGRN